MRLKKNKNKSQFMKEKPKWLISNETRKTYFERKNYLFNKIRKLFYEREIEKQLFWV